MVCTPVDEKWPITKPENVVFVYSGSIIILAPEAPKAGQFCELPSITVFEGTIGKADLNLMVRLILSVASTERRK